MFGKTAILQKQVVLCVLAVLAFTVTSCGDRATGHSQSKTLAGTKWKLEGIVDAKTGELRELEPKDCEECYRLAFNTDSTYSTYSCSNSCYGNYNCEANDFRITLYGGTRMGECGDGSQWRPLLRAVNSFSLSKNELKLFYNENNDYLLFKPWEGL